MALQVELVSPERILYSGDADMVICRSEGGDIAFLSGHAPFVGTLGIGVVRLMGVGGGSEIRAAVHGGFVEVRDNRVIILSDVAELEDQIDVERARRAEERAEEQLRHQTDAADEAALRRARVRLELAAH
jgi:F-type H+-transporting ATPase subunit epsilon